MDILDEKGRIFGVVNVVDAFVVFLVVAAAGMSTAIMLGGDDASSSTPKSNATSGKMPTEKVPVIVTVRVQNVAPYVADAIEAGRVDSEAIIGVENVSTTAGMVVTQDENGTLHEVRHPRKRTVRMQVTLNATREENGYVFRGKELEVGRKLVLDLGNVSVSGRVERM